MDDYISREDALKAVEDIVCDADDAERTCDRIIDLPSADAVPVVRCKECIYYQDNNNGYPHNECRWRTDETPDETDFCSFGEREGE